MELAEVVLVVDVTEMEGDNGGSGRIVDHICCNDAGEIER